MNFEEYKRLDPVAREFFVFRQLAKIDEIAQRRFASLWVEHAMKFVIATMAVGVIGLFFSLVQQRAGASTSIAKEQTPALTAGQ